MEAIGIMDTIAILIHTKKKQPTSKKRTHMKATNN